MRKSVVIDCFPESTTRYQRGYAVVAIDVIRATTLAISAVASGWRCFIVPTLDAALALSRTLQNPLLAGELGGHPPEGFEMNNSPMELAARADNHRPLVILSSSGTPLIHEAAKCEAAYLACFRNISATTQHISGHHSRVAVIGAGSRGEFREEDQMCCAWIAAGLMRDGYRAEDAQTEEVVDRWSRALPAACLISKSVAYLRRSGQLKDLDFIMAHFDDLYAVYIVRDGEVGMIPKLQAMPADDLAIAG
jgi:2-phosphosulfolactate phosphatase